MTALPWGPSASSRRDRAPVPSEAPLAQRAPALAAEAGEELPEGLWRGDRLCREPLATVPSGHAELDAQLPGGGWPVQALTEVLQARSGGAEWRLLGPALRRLGASGAPLLLIGPPYRPHWPGFANAETLPRWLWVRAESSAERLWAAEQVLRSGDFGAALVWLPRARAAELRRLQARARGARAPVFVFRPLEALAESSPAPLRLALAPGPSGAPWRLQVRLLKRRGPVLDAPIELVALPPALAGSVPRAGRRQQQPAQGVLEEGRSSPEVATAAPAGAHALVRADSAARA